MTTEEIAAVEMLFNESATFLKYKAEMICKALREERDRIWEAVKIIEDKHYRNPEPIEEDFMLQWTTYGDIKRVIFGEEK